MSAVAKQERQGCRKLSRNANAASKTTQLSQDRSKATQKEKLTQLTAEVNVDGKRVCISPVSMGGEWEFVGRVIGNDMNTICYEKRSCRISPTDYFRKVPAAPNNL